MSPLCGSRSIRVGWRRCFPLRPALRRGAQQPHAKHQQHSAEQRGESEVDQPGAGNQKIPAAGPDNAIQDAVAVAQEHLGHPQRDKRIRRDERAAAVDIQRRAQDRRVRPAREDQRRGYP